MKVAAITCSQCKDTIYSRARHDFHYCSCGATFIDGGREYTRYGFIPGEKPNIIEIEIDATDKELYKDWNKRLDQYGTIKKEDK